MLKKFISIRNVGRFLDCRASGDVELRRFSLFFAENGRGKSTLCALLRSLQSGDPSYVLGRSTLGENGAPTIELLLDSGLAAFDGAQWTANLPTLDIFDSTFVSANIYSGDTVELEHRRNLYGVIIGKEGVELAQKIDQLDDETRAKSTEIRDKLAALQAFVPQGMTPEAFRELAEGEEIDAKIKAAEADLQILKESDRIRKRAALSSLVLPILPSEIPSLITQELEEVAADAQHKVARQIEAHEMHAEGEAWLARGLVFTIDGTCPFCGQNLDAVEALIAAYQAYFGDAYRALRANITMKREEILRDFADQILSGIERAIDQNIAGIEFWSMYCDVPLPTLSKDDVSPTQALRDFRQAAVALLDRKIASPLEAIPPDSSYSEAEAAGQRFQRDVDSYNQAVQEANDIIEATRTSSEASDPKEVEKSLMLLRAAKTRYEPNVKEAFDAYDQATEEKKVLEASKEIAKGKLDSHSSEVMGRYEATINLLLDDINAGFRITNATHGYPGGTAATTYQIVINDTAVDLGDSSTPVDRPSFRNTLSSGDRNTLALAFFLARLEHDVAKAEKVVVFDDPFNSQDRFRKEWTVQKILEVGRSSQQVVVLSHDERFLARIWDRLAIHADERSSLQMARVGLRNTRIVEWDIEKATESPHTADYGELVAFHNEAQGDPNEISKKLRPLLETHIRSLCLGEFTDDALGEIIGKIRDEGSSHLLFHLLVDLEMINEYTRRYHHGDSPGAPREAIDTTELQGFVKRTLQIVGVQPFG